MSAGYKRHYLLYFGHICGRGNLERSSITRTPGGRAGLSPSTGKPDYSSVQMFLGDKLGEEPVDRDHFIKPATLLHFPNGREAEEDPAALTLLTAISLESGRTAAVSRDVVAGRALSTGAVVHAALSEHTR